MKRSVGILTLVSTQPAVNTLLSFEFRRSTILNYKKFSDLLIARLYNFERARRVERTEPTSLRFQYPPILLFLNITTKILRLSLEEKKEIPFFKTIIRFPKTYFGLRM